MALTDAHWNKITEAVRYKAAGHSPGDVLLVFRENWELFSDERALDEYLQGTKLEAMKATRDTQQASLVTLDAEIKKLEGGGRG